MQTHIQTVIKQIEKEYAIKILYACESGSRAWGFPSKDSDYDVRFIYVHQKNWYLSIDQKREVIEIPSHDSLTIFVDPLLDMSGWELRKALRLFRKSNPPLLEWLRSNMIYHQDFSTIKKIKDLENEIFSPSSLIYHYINMAKGNFREYLQNEMVKSKKYFYVLRPVLAAKWVQTYGTVPPMAFQTLVEILIPDSSLKSEIDRLLQRKMAGEELKLEARIDDINAFLTAELNQLETYAKTITINRIAPTSQLDQIFRETLEEVWN